MTIDQTSPVFDNLAAGETSEIVVTYDIEDEDGGSVQQSLTIIVTGTNDAPFNVDGQIDDQEIDEDESYTISISDLRDDILAIESGLAPIGLDVDNENSDLWLNLNIVDPDDNEVSM